MFELAYMALYLFFFFNDIGLWNWMLFLGMVCTCLTIGIQLIKGRKTMGFSQNMGGYIIYAGLMIGNWLFNSNPTAQWIVIIVTVVIFGGSFALIFFFHSDLDEDDSIKTPKSVQDI